MLLVPFDLSRREGDGQIGSESDGAAVADQREHWGVKWRLKRKRPKFGDYLHHADGLKGASESEGITHFLSTLLSLSVEHNGTPNTQ